MTSLDMPPMLRRHRLLQLLVLLAASPHGGSSVDLYDSSMCLERSTCGSFIFSYPFYLSDKTGVINGYNNSYCGYPGLAILCEHEKPIFIQLGGDYDVTAINHQNHTISLAYPDALTTGSCPRADHKMISIPRLLYNLYLAPDNIDYIVFLLGCSPDSTIAQPPTIYQITCQSFLSGLPNFVVPKDTMVENWSKTCNQTVQVPVLKYDTMETIDPQWGNGGYGKILRRGFQLAWNNTGRATACAQCEESGGRCGYSQTGGFTACLCPNGLANYHDCRSSSTDIIAITSSVFLPFLLLAIVLGYKKCRPKKEPKETVRIESILQKNGTMHLKRYTYAQVKRMTKSFTEKLGQGGFGAVYRGDLSDGHRIAVKMLKDYMTDGEAFINEVASISRTSHVNVVTLLGFCSEGSRRALIYDYMPNGSLERYAFKNNSKGENTLSWEKLFDIAVGIARGLEYLHRGCNTRIVHFDIKPHNILLDQDFCPKISDFGLAKLCLNKESVISIGCARGTIGYIAPEVYSKQFGAVSSKSDVYSYGMMILEMLGARDKNINADSESSSQYFPQWIYEHLDDYCASASEINGEITEVARKMIVVGLWCIQLTSTTRPTMSRVVEMLEGSAGVLELPPKVLLC